MLRDMKKNAKNGAIAIGKTKVALTNADGSYRSCRDHPRYRLRRPAALTASQRGAALGHLGDESLKGIWRHQQGPDAGRDDRACTTRAAAV